jgi:outer membrane receptor protein involved in Fe transport
MRKVYVFFWAALMATMPTAHAQVLSGSIVGQVLDTTSAGVPGANVRVTHRQTNQVRTALTSTSGEYAFQSLPGGVYDIAISKDGFQTFKTDAIQLTAGQVARVDASLRVGQISETVSVTADAAVLQTDRAEVRSEVTAKQLENLPTPLGRNYENLLITVPGLSPPANNHSVAVNPSRGLSFSAMGTTRNSNSVRIEGAIANNTWLPHVNAYVPGLEAIEAVSVVTGSFDADLGLSGGSAVNVQIKSGTNSVHGSAFEYHSDNAIKAKPYFLPSSQRKPKAINNQFGGTFGGPIRKDKLFYFASYEGSYDRATGSQILTVPTANIRAGDMSGSANEIYDPLTGAVDGSGRTAFPGKRVPSNRIDPIALKILKDLPPPNLSGVTNNFFAAGPIALTRHKLDTKGNWNATDKLSFTGRLGWLRYNFDNPPAFGPLVGTGVSSAYGKLGPGYGDTYSITGSATYVARPNLVIDGYISGTLINTNAEPPRLDEKLGLEYLGLPGTNGPSREYGGWPQFSITSYAAMGNPGSGSAGGPVVERNRQRQYTGNASWTKGAHAIRFGGDVIQYGLNRFETGASAGAFTFDGGPTALRGGPSSNQYNSFATFLLGLPTNLQKTFIPFDNNRNTTRNHSYSFYLKDQWQISRRLTASFGLRWDRFPMGARENRGMERYNFDTNQMLICGQGNVPKDCGYEIPWTNFSPRIGLAWRATDTFVVRAGFGINYDPYPLAFVRDLIGNYPSGLNLSVPAANSFQYVSELKQGIPAIVVPDISTGVIPVPAAYSVRSLTQRVGRGYIESFNLTIQKQLPAGFTWQAGYVASRQIHINQILNLNAGQTLGAGTAGQPYFQKYGRTAETAQLGPVGNNKYDSLQTTLSKRFAKGYQVNVVYTWSKVIGICCDELSDNPPRVQALNYFYLNRALMPYDRTHNFNASFVAELPFGSGKRLATGRAASAILGGWQVNGLLSIYSGSPFSVSASDTLSLPGSTQRADQVKPEVAIFGDPSSYFDPTAFAGVTGARFGTAGYNSLRGPGVSNLDFSIYRTFKITEKLTTQFRAEVFNLTNTPHFSNPSANASNLQLNGDGSVRNLGGFTTITSTSGIGREGVDERLFRFGLRFAF